MPKEQYMCQLCANHGIFNQPKKGHKQKCMYRSCSCNLCALNSKRRALDQMERQLKQNEDVRASYSEESLRAPLPPLTNSVALPPSPNVNSIFPVRTIPHMAPYCVALPATMSRRDVRFQKKEHADQSWPVPSRQNTLDAVLEQISAARSIFHSAEQLAG